MNLFEQLGLGSKIVQAVDELGFTAPTPIQEKAIPELLTGTRDFVGLAQTGTGKTAAFGLPLLELINPELRQPQALILCPTRELCLQITNDLKNFSKHIGQLNIVAVYGGANIGLQIKDLKRGAQIVVATPGRMLDILGRNVLNFDNVRYSVLDEADEMLNMGFQEDINSILSTTPKDKKTWLFSATMPNEVRRIAQNYMTDPFELTVGTKNTGNANIEHEYYVVRAREKYAAFKRLVDFNPEIFGIVFCRTKIETQEIAEALIKDGYNADALHGDLSQQQRDKVMKRYRDRSLQLLIATDVAARGIDVNDVTHVINYSLPDEVENYTHRSGRTARAGKTGVSMNLVNSKELGKIRQIERIIGKKFTKAEIPAGFDVCEKQLFAIIHKIHNVEVNEGQLEQYMDRINTELADMSKEELIKRIASLEFNRFLEYYKNAPDLNARADERPERGDSNSMRAGSGFTRLFINLGSLDEFTRGDMLRYICDNSGIPGAKIGRIDVKGVYSFFEVVSEDVEKIFSGLNSIDFKGRTVRVEVSQDGDRRREGRSGGFNGRPRERSFGGDRERSGGFRGGDRERSGGNRERSGGYGSGNRRRSDSSSANSERRGGRW
ncbi:DEAD/DEAH box helicase [Solitalea koreensis]|uniref:ATP-dependent RNA helicase DeaD n=1 Tax=Solitalea koreensis TaxID=543615 RepID=A0A521DHU1_9SPHI|nr:DEAD/DEAH box helicase [Solitalea koreensis]SMO71198.1 ATP-dependent RNA helicase DeaD [Solitalea koreensis]